MDRGRLRLIPENEGAMFSNTVTKTKECSTGPTEPYERCSLSGTRAAGRRPGPEVVGTVCCIPADSLCAQRGGGRGYTANVVECEKLGKPGQRDVGALCTISNTSVACNHFKL